MQQQKIDISSIVIQSFYFRKYFRDFSNEYFSVCFIEFYSNMILEEEKKKCVSENLWFLSSDD